MSNLRVAVPSSVSGFHSKEFEIPARKPFEDRLQKAVDKALYAGGRPGAQLVRNFLNGTWLGEPLHVVLTDIPVGAWTAAMIFDALSLTRRGREFALAADTSIAIGLAGAACSAAAGVTDWSDVDPPARRRGLIHGLLNVSATALFATSLVLRGKKSRAAGRLSAAIGYAVMAFAAHLGGKMVYENRVGVDRTAGQRFPTDFVAVLAERELADNKPTRAVHNGVPILLVRRGDRLFAMAETCSHFSGPLSEGTLDGDSIVCPLHNSRFALEDGRVLDGPAVHAQPCLEARLRGGQIEVRYTPVKE
ncbi:MAG TPA: DUF2231 domain-containing protein [Candidatus Angelobacter sp.]|nr:DUF2231 domain-containing protein [Candidatus Angelobacter sp.]